LISLIIEEIQSFRRFGIRAQSVVSPLMAGEAAFEVGCWRE